MERLMKRNDCTINCPAGLTFLLEKVIGRNRNLKNKKMPKCDEDAIILDTCS